jgi:hypothetical protein
LAAGFGAEWALTDRISIKSEALWLRFEEDSETRICKLSVCNGGAGEPKRFDVQDDLFTAPPRGEFQVRWLLKKRIGLGRVRQNKPRNLLLPADIAAALAGDARRRNGFGPLVPDHGAPDPAIASRRTRATSRQRWCKNTCARPTLGRMAGSKAVARGRAAVEAMGGPRPIRERFPPSWRVDQIPGGYRVTDDPLIVPAATEAVPGAIYVGAPSLVMAAEAPFSVMAATAAPLVMAADPFSVMVAAPAAPLVMAAEAPFSVMPAAPAAGAPVATPPFPNEHDGIV